MNGASTSGLVFDPILPAPVIAILGALLLLLTLRVYWRVGGSIGLWRNLTLLCFRVAGIALVVLLLLQPSRREVLPPPTKDRVTLIGLDTSSNCSARSGARPTWKSRQAPFSSSPPTSAARFSAPSTASA